LKQFGLGGMGGKESGCSYQRQRELQCQLHYKQVVSCEGAYAFDVYGSVLMGE
jgi:hypothetical protein